MTDEESREWKGRIRALEIAYIGLVGALSGVLAEIGQSPMRTKESIRRQFISAIKKSLMRTSTSLPDIPDLVIEPDDILLAEISVALQNLSERIHES